MKTNNNDFKEGLKAGIPIALGYFPVAFSFGIMAAGAGIPAWAALLISMTNLTSAGQVAGVTVIAAMGGYIEMALTQLVINLRYALMSLSLSQKLDDNYTLLSRLAVSFGITDEIFAVSSGKKGTVSKIYMAGLIFLPYISWASATFLGGFLGEILPDKLQAAMEIAIYGMFIAIIVPPARKIMGVLIVVCTAVAISCALAYIPIFSSISSGFAIIICAIIASLIGAIFFPIADEEEVTANE